MKIPAENSELENIRKAESLETLEFETKWTNQKSK